ncbi:restriction endonuclease subunit S [Frankia sp. Cj3]|uniref:restriction endonuclease subunit S n=1 Tax=Frankia sp. Cj3 TaxID=2880976 RepID=UPI001EF3DB78|nr:restriction endonuclease subunit S [Frankia sp. Cj3]
MTDRPWHTEKLGRTALIGNGSTPRRETAAYWNGGEFPWLNSSVVNESRVGHADQFVTEAALRECHLPVVAPGSILVGLTGQGKTRGMATILDIEATVNQHVAYVTPDRSTWLPDYLLWSLRVSYGELRRMSEENGSTKGGLTCEALKQYRLVVPPLKEQRAIADYLDRETARIDTLIEEQQRLIELLRERRRAVALHAIDQQIDAGATADKLGRSARIGNGSTPRRETTNYWYGGEFPWLNSSVVNQSRVTQADQFVTDVALSECHLPIVAPGSVLVGLTGQGKTRGMATLLEIEATINQHVAYITPDRGTWLPEYLLWSLRASYDDLRRLSEENGSTKGGLTCEALKQYRLAIPSLDEQRRVATYLDEQTAKIDSLIGETERFIELSRERRAALITAAVTGQVDVREMV